LPEAVVFDSSAVLALFFGERGCEITAPLVEGALLSTVNLTEIHSRMIDRGGQPDQAWGWIQGLKCQICFYSDEHARVAAELVTITRPFGLSLGDRACLALAIERKATVYTTDKAWKNLDLGIGIEVIR
jgi:PIN domain nuclease of toxin-antitoxin system